VSNRIGYISFQLALLIVGILCVWSLIISVGELGSDSQGFAIRRLVPTIPLLILTVAYALLLRRRFVPSVLPSFVLSCAVVGAALSWFGAGALKGFAPAAPNEASSALWQGVGVTALVIITVAIVFGLVWRRTSAHVAGT